MKTAIQRRVVRCCARSASISRRAATSRAIITARALSTSRTPPPRCPVAMISAAAIRSPAGSSISAANARSAASVPVRAFSRLASAVTGSLMAAGAERALASSASSRPRLAVSMSDRRLVHCSRPSSFAVRCCCRRVLSTRGRKMTASPAARPATGQRVIASTARQATSASSIRRAEASDIVPARRHRGGGRPGRRGRPISSRMPSTSPAAISPPARAASTVIASRPAQSSPARPAPAGPPPAAGRAAPGRSRPRPAGPASGARGCARRPPARPGRRAGTAG